MTLETQTFTGLFNKRGRVPRLGSDRKPRFVPSAWYTDLLAFFFCLCMVVQRGFVKENID